MALFSGLLALGISIWGASVRWGRAQERIDQKLSGFGDRLKRAETEQESQRGLFGEQNQNIQRLLGQHETLMRLVGESRGSAIAASSAYEALGTRMEKKFSDMSEELHNMELRTIQQLTVIQTRLDIEVPKVG